MPPQHTKLRHSLTIGVRKGLRGFFWMLKVLIPISLLTAVLVWSGVLNRMDGVMTPVMGLLGLPAEAALPLLIGTTASIYGALAAMVPLGLSTQQMTLIAIFLVISHNLIQESVVQRESGYAFLKAVLARLTASVVTVMAVARIWGETGASPQAGLAPEWVPQPFGTMLRGWLVDTGILSVKVLVIIIALMVLLEVMRSYRWIDRMAWAMTPVLKLLGLRRQSGFLWLTAALFGLSYGAAVIVEETRTGKYAPAELERLHLSIGINHAMVEDPAIFLSLGLSPFWLWVPRFVAAVVAVQVLILFKRVLPRKRRDRVENTL
ncbi:MAG: nucleoside recognition domain-containing protein [Desulfosarcinaceae bacterium]|nr:nucleoside recognition domain-containing protein [Desulfosarcinaceae bacterium]